MVLHGGIEDIPALMAWLQDRAASAAWPSALSFALELCVEEAVANTIMHGRVEGAGSHEVAVSLHEDQAAIVISIEDDGRPFDPTNVAPPPEIRSLDEIGIGGLGVHLIRKFSSDMHYERSDGRNCLTLTFQRSPDS